MNRTILLVPTICVLITSCSSNSEVVSTQETSNAKSATETSGRLASITDTSGRLECISHNQEYPMDDIYLLIYGFRYNNDRFPRSPQELIEDISKYTNAPLLELDDYEVLTFTQEEDKSLTVVWKTKAEPISEGTFTIDPSGESAQSGVLFKTSEVKEGSIAQPIK